MYDLRMSRGASTVVNTCAGVQPGEQVLIITEHSKMSIAESLAAAAYAAGAEATLVVMTPRDLDGQEPPAAIAAAMRATDVFLCAVSRSITHTHAVREATAAGAVAGADPVHRGDDGARRYPGGFSGHCPALPRHGRCARRKRQRAAGDAAGHLSLLQRKGPPGQCALRRRRQRAVFHHPYD